MALLTLVPSMARATRSAAHASQPGTGTVRFVAVGDTGTGGPGQLSLARELADYHAHHAFDTVLLLGDNIYTEGGVDDAARTFEQPYTALLREGVKFYAALGNHDPEAEIRYPPFHMGGRRYYSFTEGSGLVQFFALDSNHLDPGQLRWLQSSLAASRSPWRLVYFHHPIYSCGAKHPSDWLGRLLLEPLFVHYGVNAAFSGHDHIYARSVPQHGVWYFEGGAGAAVNRGELDRSSPILAAGSDQTNSFIYVELTPEQLRFRAVDTAGRILDSGTLAAGSVLRSDAGWMPVPLLASCASLLIAVTLTLRFLPRGS